MSRFKKAERKQAKLRLALTGPSGAGKTFSALKLAKGIGGRIAVIDTERGSASLYADIADFDTLELQAPFSPESYIEAIAEAQSAGYDVLVIDSLTHEWNGKGGVLEIHDVVTRTRTKGNSYTAWGEVTPRHNAFIDAILQADLHVICTMRSKSDFVLTENDRGKQVPKKVGLAPIQRDGLEYEFTVVLDIDKDGNFAVASKDRTRLFDLPVTVSEKDGERLRHWLMSGKSVEDQIEEEVAALKQKLQDAAMQGTSQFTLVWQANRSPARDRIAENKTLMGSFQKAATAADVAEGDDDQQESQRQEEMEGTA